MKRKFTVVFLAISILLISTIMLFVLNQKAREKAPTPVNGVLDLRNWSFEHQGSIQLNGSWAFYFNQFLSHEDFKKGVATSPVSLTLPCTSENISSVKPFHENEFYGTLRLIIQLPANSTIYGLRSDIVLTSYRLYIDGIFTGEVGKVGTNSKKGRAEYNKLTSYFNPTNHQVELIYHTSDFTAADCTIVAPTLGIASQISQDAQLAMGRDLVLFGMLLIMGMYHFGLYLMRNKDKAPLYFGVFCVLFSLRMLLVGERFLPTKLELDFLIYGKAAYLSVFIGFTALCGFLYHTLEGLFPNWFLKANLALGASSSILTIFIPYTALSPLLNIFAVFGFITIAYTIIRLIYGAIHKYPYALIVLMGFSFLGITFINDMIYQLTLANLPSLIPLGIAVFTFTQAYTLSARFSSAFTQAERLSEENSAITSELKQINSTLETLVQERTSELELALKETELISKTDYLTLLPNRRLTLELIDDLIAKKKNFYIGIADLDHFKNINDRYGHAKGDEILIRISNLLQKAVGKRGFVGRWGGEEFIIVLESTKAETIREKAQKICQMAANCKHDDIGEQITLTIGLCQYHSDLDIDQVIARADKALYEGKQSGRNRFIIVE